MCPCMHAQRVLVGWVVSTVPEFLSSKAVILTTSPHYCSHTCFSEAIGIVQTYAGLMPVVPDLTKTDRQRDRNK